MYNLMLMNLVHAFVYMVAHRVFVYRAPIHVLRAAIHLSFGEIYADRVTLLPAFRSIGGCVIVFRFVICFTASVFNRVLLGVLVLVQCLVGTSEMD